MFRDREDAGRKLAELIADAVNGRPAVVLGVARGGVIVAASVARSLGLPLDVAVPRKLGAPENPELGIGAVAPGVRVIDENVAEAAGASDVYIAQEAAIQEREISRRTALYRRDRSPLDLSGKQAIVVDDGVATGGTALAAIRWAVLEGAASVVFAAPVAPAGVEGLLKGECDQVLILEKHEWFGSVGQWYERFDQVDDSEVVSALDKLKEP